MLTTNPSPVSQALQNPPPPQTFSTHSSRPPLNVSGLDSVDKPFFSLKAFSRLINERVSEFHMLSRAHEVEANFENEQTQKTRFFEEKYHEMDRLETLCEEWKNELLIEYVRRCNKEAKEKYGPVGPPGLRAWGH
ncbi:MAG: hypothetical protein Q9221_003230 [Calogaya cf. arnoldii]